MLCYPRSGSLALILSLALFLGLFGYLVGAVGAVSAVGVKAVGVIAVGAKAVVVGAVGLALSVVSQSVRSAVLCHGLDLAPSLGSPFWLCLLVAITSLWVPLVLEQLGPILLDRLILLKQLVLS
jgi:hypothetical protein